MKQRLHPAVLHPDRSAVHAHGQCPLFERLEIPPDRRFGNLKFRGEFSDGAHAVAERGEDSLLALRRKQFARTGVFFCHDDII